MEDSKGNGGVRNGKLPSWQSITGLIAVIAMAVKVIFFAGDSSARTDEKIATLSTEVKKIEQEYARADVINERLSNIEKSQAHEEQILEDQNKVLAQINEDLRRRR